MATNLYIDESGFMTKNYAIYKPYFIIAIVKVNNDKLLARQVKRFVRDNFSELKKIDVDNRMFINGEFHELKGSELTPKLKRKFIKEVCVDNCFEVFYIRLENSEVDDSFFNNKARVFNYLLKLFFIHSFHKGLMKDVRQLNLQIDERNVKTQSKAQLSEYLNTELILSEQLIDDQITVRYFDSANNKFIQVADVFANLYFSQCMNKAYTKEFEKLCSSGYLKDVFYFPPRKRKNK